MLVGGTHGPEESMRLFATARSICSFWLMVRKWVAQRLSIVNLLPIMMG